MSRGTGRMERGPGALGGWREAQGHWEDGETSRGTGSSRIALPLWLEQRWASFGSQQGLAVQFFLVPWKSPSGKKKRKKKKKGKKKGKQDSFSGCWMNSWEVKFQGWLEQLLGVAQPLLSHPAQGLQVQGWDQLQVLPWGMGRDAGMAGPVQDFGYARTWAWGNLCCCCLQGEFPESSRSPPSAAFEETKGGSLKHPLRQE